MRCLFVVMLLASPAVANPLQLGASYGIDEDQTYQATSHALGIFARVGIAPMIGAQLDIAKLDNDSMGTTIRTGSGLLVVDLAVGSVVPIAFGGLGLDATHDLISDRTFAHAELGAGLEYRALGGLVIGADVRIGARKVIGETDRAIEAFYEPITLGEGEYRAARLTLAARF
jgi:hypothetical protein